MTVKNTLLTGHKTYSTIGSAGEPVTMGTYDLSVNRAISVSFVNCRQTNDIDDNRYWGILGSNYCKNLLYDNCVLSRFDAHKGVANATIRNSNVEHNTALGGPGGLGGNGGEGTGGGLTSTAGAILSVISTTVAHNHAQGGESGVGGNGGNGLGGGLYDYSDATLNLQDNTIVSYNLALGGEAEDGGIDGQGIGGGVYYLGTFDADLDTVIEKNQASTGNDNVWP